MNSQEKSQALAKLMGWGLGNARDGTIMITNGYPVIGRESWFALMPYSHHVEGLAQFAAILLKFPEVIGTFVCTSGHTDERATTAERYQRYGGDYQGYLTADRPVTQAALLDAVLKMNGIENMNEMKTIDLDIECPACKGTGVYVGVCERDGAAVVCSKCNGRGNYRYHYRYTPFTKRKTRDDVTRVYKESYGYIISTGTVSFKLDGTKPVNMDREGVSYEEFIDGKQPEHIKQLGCPMMADQSVCHNISGFVDECHKLNGGSLLGIRIKECKNQCNKAECWKRFSKGDE